MIVIMDRGDQWAEDHGIHVGYCNRHKVKVWDETCDECEDERVCSEESDQDALPDAEAIADAWID